MEGVKGMVQPMCSIEVCVCGGGCIIYHGSFLMYAMTNGWRGWMEQESG
jgi:hypothetical protein